MKKGDGLAERVAKAERRVAELEKKHTALSARAAAGNAHALGGIRENDERDDTPTQPTKTFSDQMLDADSEDEANAVPEVEKKMVSLMAGDLIRLRQEGV